MQHLKYASRLLLTKHQVGRNLKNPTFNICIYASPKLYTNSLCCLFGELDRSVNSLF